jgi:histidinol-phosphate aminotransferase
MPIPTPVNAALKDLPTYQPGRPIEEVARELGLPAADIIKLASNENPLGPSPVALAAMQKVLANLNLYPDGNAFYLKQKLAEKLDLAPTNFVLGNGSNEIIEFGARLHDARRGRGGFAVLFRRLSAGDEMFGANRTLPGENYGHDLAAMLRPSRRKRASCLWRILTTPRHYCAQEGTRKIRLRHSEARVARIDSGS